METSTIVLMVVVAIQLILIVVLFYKQSNSNEKLEVAIKEIKEIRHALSGGKLHDIIEWHKEIEERRNLTEKLESEIKDLVRRALQRLNELEGTELVTMIRKITVAIETFRSAFEDVRNNSEAVAALREAMKRIDSDIDDLERDLRWNRSKDDDQESQITGILARLARLESK